jgi:hypothetical protein
MSGAANLTENAGAVPAAPQAAAASSATPATQKVRKRAFKLHGSLRLPDTRPHLPIAEAFKAYHLAYPAYANGLITRVENEGDTEIYEVQRPPMQVKGGA